MTKAYKVLHIPTGQFVYSGLIYYYLTDTGSIFLDEVIIFDKLVEDLVKDMRDQVAPRIGKLSGLYIKKYNATSAEFEKIEINIDLDETNTNEDYDYLQSKTLYYE